MVHITAILQEPCLETRQIKYFRDLYTNIFQDPCIETWRFSGNSDNLRGLYTQILSRSMIRNTEMPKKLFLLFVQYTWFLHANFVKIRDPKHGDAKKVVSFIYTIYMVFTRKFCQDP